MEVQSAILSIFDQRLILSMIGLGQIRDVVAEGLIKTDVNPHIGVVFRGRALNKYTLSPSWQRMICFFLE